MIEDAVGGVFKVLARFIGRFFIEIIFELLLKGPGYLICKQFTKSELDPDGFLVIFTGFVFWVIVGFSIYGIYSSMGAGGNA